MPLSKLQFRPGIVRDLTSYSNEGGWRDGDKVRFRLGYPEKMGGWSKYSSSTFLGTCRALHNWIALDGSNFLGLGTHVKYYIEEGGTYNDITPIRATTAAGDVTFAATNGSGIITVSDTNHGAVLGDFVTFSGAVDLGGNVTAAILNAEHEVTAVTNNNVYEIFIEDFVQTFTKVTQTSTSGTGTGAEFTITTDGNGGYSVATITKAGTGYAASDTITIDGTVLGGATPANDLTITISSVTNGEVTAVTSAGTSRTANASDTGNGGASVVGAYQINIGLNSQIGGTGWGAGTWSHTGGWGQASPGGLTTTTQIRLWSHDNFGEDLLINPRDAGIYYWDKGSGTSARAVELSTTGSSQTSVPTICKQIMVSDRDRHVLAFGCDAIGANSSATQGNGVQDPLLIRFASQENPVDWWPVATNTAGDLRLGSGSTFVRALETKREILIWTDTALTSMRFIGPPFTFGLQQLASNITIAGPNSAVATEDYVFWMGLDNFYVYAGQTTQLPCTVKEKVFNDINLDQIDKIYSGVNAEFSEVFWFYPAEGSFDNNRYVVYNYLDKVWYFGTLERTAWLDRGTRTFPLATDNNGYVYNHEFGYDADGAAMDSFIESSVMDIGDGDHFTYIRRVIPDLSFSGSTSISTPQATFTIKARDFPGEDFGNTAAGTTTRTQVSPVEEYTKQLYVRARGRSFAMRVESNSLGSKWRLGSPRVDLRQDGRR